MRKKRKPAILLLLLLIGIAAVIYFIRQKPEPGPAPGPVSGKLVVRFLDIGQGDANLIQLPDGETMLIDSGDSGSPTVELLKKFGVKQIDLLIATHPHADHIGEMRDVMREFKVKEVWDSGFPHTTVTYADMLKEIKSQGIKFSTPKQGETRQIGQVFIEVLHPANDLPDAKANNASLVVRLTFGGKRFLFTGDAELESWQQMLKSEKQKLRADLLKAAHHGSSNGTTQESLDAVHPSIFTISCAAGNSYHHPQPKVIDMLEQRTNSIAVYRTDLQGTITAICDGNSIEMSAEKQVAQDNLYLTGDEVAGNVASGRSGRMNSGRRSGGKAK